MTKQIKTEDYQGKNRYREKTKNISLTPSPRVTQYSVVENLMVDLNIDMYTGSDKRVMKTTRCTLS